MYGISPSPCSFALTQALDGAPTEQLMQQTQVPQYAYAPNMGQPWVLTCPHPPSLSLSSPLLSFSLTPAS